MYIRATGGYDRHGQQHSEGMFLFVTMPDRRVNRPDFGMQRAFLRRVKLEQLGHFMMGEIKFNDVKLTVSGPLGGDGLPATVPDYIWSHGIPVPKEITESWGKDNDFDWAGALRRWANENENAIAQAGRRVIKPARYVNEGMEYGFARERRWGLTAPGFIVDKLWYPKAIDGKNDHAIASYVHDRNGYLHWLSWNQDFSPPEGIWAAEEAVRLLNLRTLGAPDVWIEQLEEHRHCG